MASSDLPPPPPIVTVESSLPIVPPDAESKDPSSSVGGELAEPGALPQGTIDPIYEAKAQILNHAVRTKYCALLAVPT
jgi:hypothetical protein